MPKISNDTLKLPKVLKTCRAIDTVSVSENKPTTVFEVVKAMAITINYFMKASLQLVRKKANMTRHI